MNAYTFVVFAIGFSVGTLFWRLLMAYASPPLWYQRWKNRRDERRFQEWRKKNGFIP